MNNSWQPIETAPKNRTILIREGQGYLPDLVRWKERQPEITLNDTRYLAQPAGWFRLFGSRSCVLSPKEWFDIPD